MLVTLLYAQHKVTGIGVVGSVVQRGVMAEAGQDVVDLPLLGVEVVGVAGGDDVEPGAGGQHH